MKLSINIDHVATIRQARGEAEPDPVAAAVIGEMAGADGIVCHLREDRRHINDRDVRLLREIIKTKLDLEMAATSEMVKIAIDIMPDLVTLVPEKREELTTEGGLDLISQKSKLAEVTAELISKNIPVSFFIYPLPENIDLAIECGADVIEIHTGKYANCKNEKDLINELSKIATVAKMASEMGLTVTVGHGLNYKNIYPIKNISEIKEVSIGHAIISRAVFTGLDNAVKEMLNIIGSSN